LTVAAPTLRVLIVEDDDKTRAALTTVLAAHGLTIHAAVATGREALAKAVGAEVALVDLGLPDMSGIDVIAALRSHNPGLPVLVHTVNEESEALLAALRAGAHGYLLKGTGAKELVEALRAVVSGHAPISPQVARHLVTRFHKTEEALEALTAREQEVLTLIAHGHAYAAVASALGIGTSTVQSHIKAIYRKLGVASKAEATLVAIRMGWLS
jgi:two-component system nitrate/nitrite response regulator NarL